MTDKEKIKELTEFLAEMWIDYPPSSEEVAEVLCNASYHKTIWYKVADGDLPEYAGSYLVVCGDESLPEYNVDFYENFWNGKRWVHNEGRVIAWTDLPTYKE